MSYDVYMHGQILGTHSFYLKDGFLQPDEYSELEAKYFLPGGETGSAATVLASLGVSVKIDGTHIGTEVAPMLNDFYKDKPVDLSSLYFDSKYQGLMDYVIVADLVRSPMGEFQTLYKSGMKRWNAAKEEDVIGCKVAALDPFFLEETDMAMELMVKHGKRYVTIDCDHTNPIHQHAAINVVSKECLSEHYAGENKEDVFKKLQDTAEGLVIITTGNNEILYGRKGQEMKKFKPYSVDVKSTLGAGDTFKAACVYGLLNKMSDDEIVSFASACSAVAISRYPLPLKPPTLEEVKSLMQSRK